MKLKRLTALALSFVLMASLVLPRASAVSFSDIVGHWAQTDVEYLATAGIINGYNDGTFKPNANMTAAEALLFCARSTGLDAATKYKIADARRSEVNAILPQSIHSWATNEMAICLEVGIITPAELTALCQSGAISREISRENLCYYLVRAMQLEPLAKGLTSYNMTFTDTSSISPGLQPYVYLLNLYGIVKGDETGKFNPRGAVTRASMATMLRRSLDFMKEKGIVLELPEYTVDNWMAGNIVTATEGANGSVLLILNSDLSGTRSITIPTSAKIYENNMQATSSALRPGRYARVNTNTKGTPTSVRLGGVLTAYSGTVSSLIDGQLVLTTESGPLTLEIDRFTEVQVGKVSGDRTLIDEGSGYSSAVCQVDELGHLATVKLSGGTRVEQGILAGVEKTGASGVTVRISGFDGVTTRYPIPAGAGVTVNGVAGSLSQSQVGGHLTLRVSNDNGQVLAASLDTQTKYVQGAITGTNFNRSPSTITIRDINTGRYGTYEISTDTDMTYDGERISMSRISNSWFATAMLSGDSIVMLRCYSGSSTTEGVITSINYGSPTVLTVKRADESEVSFQLDLTDLPVIYRGGKESTFDRLRTGDEVVIALRYNEVESIDATPRSANVNGTITKITMEATGMTLELALADGSNAVYQVADMVSVTQDGAAIAATALKPGFKVSMVTDGDQVISIEVDKSSSNANQLTGRVIYVNVKDQTIFLEATDSTGLKSAITVSAKNAGVIAANGDYLSLGTLQAEDVIQIFGSYDGLTFNATLIIRT